MGEATRAVHFHGLVNSISIHASRGGSDPDYMGYFTLTVIFQSTLPVGEATDRPSGYVCNVSISIHASRGGSDLSIRPPFLSQVDFNPRFPWGKRPHGRR